MQKLIWKIRRDGYRGFHRNTKTADTVASRLIYTVWRKSAVEWNMIQKTVLPWGAAGKRGTTCACQWLYQMMPFCSNVVLTRAPKWAEQDRKEHDYHHKQHFFSPTKLKEEIIKGWNPIIFPSLSYKVISFHIFFYMNLPFLHAEHLRFKKYLIDVLLLPLQWG